MEPRNTHEKTFWAHEIPTKARKCYTKKAVLRNLKKFTGKHQYQSLFFNKCASLRPATSLKRHLADSSIGVFLRIIKKLLFYRTRLNDCFWFYLKSCCKDSLLQGDRLKASVPVPPSGAMMRVLLHEFPNPSCSVPRLKRSDYILMNWHTSNKQVWLDARRHKNIKDIKISWIAWASFWIRFRFIQLLYA